MEKQIVYEFIKSINEHNIDSIYALMADDFKFIDAYGNEETGKMHMKESWIGYFCWFPDYAIEIINTFSDADIVVVLGFAQGTYQNKRTDNNENHWRIPAAWRVIVEKNKIKQWQVYCDSKIPYDIIRKNEQNHE